MKVQQYIDNSNRAFDKKRSNKNPFNQKKFDEEWAKARKEMYDKIDEHNRVSLNAANKIIQKMPKEDQPAAYAYYYGVLGYDW